MTGSKYLLQLHRSLESTIARRGGAASAIQYEVLQCVRSAFAAVAAEFPPTNVEKLGASLGVTSIRQASLTVDGRLRRKDGEYIIEVKQNNSAARQRFTIAHELGHLIVGRGGALGSTARGRGRESGVPTCAPAEEKLCDYAAAEILMPSDWVWTFLCERPAGLASISELARTCQTSIEAAAVRLVEVGPSRCRLVWWRRRDNALGACRSFPPYDAGVLCSMRVADPPRSIISKVLADGKVRSGKERIVVEGEVGTYNIEAWKGSRSTVTSLFFLDRLEQSAPAQRALFDR